MISSHIGEFRASHLLVDRRVSLGGASVEVQELGELSFADCIVHVCRVDTLSVFVCGLVIVPI